jgi:hypothetical protein
MALAFDGDYGTVILLFFGCDQAADGRVGRKSEAPVE